MLGEDKGDRKTQSKTKRQHAINLLSIPFPQVCSPKTSKRKDSQVHDCNKVKGKKKRQRRERVTLPYLGCSCGR